MLIFCYFQELNIGVKEAQVLIAGSLVWEGTIAKAGYNRASYVYCVPVSTQGGFPEITRHHTPYSVQGCGTQVFDYCTEISLGGGTTRAEPIWMDSTPLPVLDDPLTPPRRPPSSRPCSGRMSGLRGQLLSQRESEPPSLFRSSSSSHLPTCFDDHPPRLKTAVSVFQLCLDFRHL